MLTMVPLQFQKLQIHVNIALITNQGNRLTFVVSATAPFTTRYSDESRYLGNNSANRAEYAGQFSDDLTTTAFPAAMAEVLKQSRYSLPLRIREHSVGLPEDRV